LRKVSLWKGTHDADIYRRIEAAWHGRDLLILFPPKVNDFTFLPKLPVTSVEWVGEWEGLPSVNFEKIVGTDAPAYPAEPVLGLFSTGTLGQKLVLYSRENITSCLGAIFELFDESRIGQIFCYPQPFHTFGLLLGYVHAIEKGKRLVVPEGPYSSSAHARWLETVDKNTLTLGTPTHFKDLITYVDKIGATPPASYASIIGAAQVTTALWQASRTRLGIEAPSIGYGATEASPGVTHLPPGQAPQEDGEVGYPLSHLEVGLRPGEGIEFSGKSVCLATITDGVIDFPTQLCIRDEVRRRDDGVLVYQGRNDLVLNRGGEKFALEQIERTVRGATGVECVCVPVADERLGQELGLVVEKTSLPESDLKDAIYRVLKETLHRDFDRRLFTVVTKLPLNGSSKVDRQMSANILQESIRGIK